MKPAIKVCGIRDAAFASAAADMGVDYLGFIFAAASPRRVSVDQAHEIASALPNPPRRVGVFAGQTADEILAIAAAVPLDVVQLHGPYDESAVAAVKKGGFEVWLLDNGRETIADAVLLDGRDGGRTGGTGRRADWSRIAALKGANRRVVLAGGISADNVAAAIQTGADIIDVNSSLETFPGVKTLARLEVFIKAAQI